MDEITVAVETVTSAPKGSLWDLFELEPHKSSGPDEPFDRASVLQLLSDAGLWRLRGWLEEHREQAIARYGRERALGLWAQVSVLGWLSYLPRDEALVPDCPDQGALPASGTAYTSTGRAIDIMMPFKVEMLRRRPGYMSERDLAEALGIKRSTLRDMLGRMKEMGFFLEKKVTADELAYIAGAGLRGRRKSEDRPQA